MPAFEAAQQMFLQQGVSSCRMSRGVHALGGLATAERLSFFEQRVDNTIRDVAVPRLPREGGAFSTLRSAASMKLQYKAWLIVVATITGLTGASVLVSQHSISAAFEELERHHGQLESERARRLLNQQLSGLTATLQDYAYWTDTVDFVQGRQPEYFTDNFGTDNMRSLGITSVLVLDAGGAPSASAELTAEPALRPVGESMTHLLSEMGRPVLQDATSETVISTYRQVDGELFLVAVAAIRSQFEVGSRPRGALVMARRFDAVEMGRFSDILMHPVRLSFTGPPTGEPISRPVGNADMAEWFAPVLDREGHAAAYLVLDLDRELVVAGRTLAVSAALQVALAGLAVGALLLFLLNHLVLRRLQKVHEELTHVTEQGIDGSSTLTVNGSDELAGLASGINALLIKTRADAMHQKQAHQRQESLQLQLLQSQKTEALGRFTSGIAHDFNNSLAAISGWVRLAKDDLPPQHPSEASLEQSLKSIRYASGLMKQLLSFSRQSAPRMEQLRLATVVEEARTLVALGKMGKCVLEVECRTNADWINADPTQMQQVVVNLLINASDAMHGEGTITLVLDARHSDDINPDVFGKLLQPLSPGHYVTLLVRDHGPGIAPEHLGRVFDPFFTTKTSGKGTGLGLSVVQGIIARHGGAVGVSSTEGDGACFVLALPAMVQASDEDLRPQPPRCSTQRRVLFAEDDDQVREAWRIWLERQGWDVTTVCDGKEAWDRFQADNGRWDTVLTDLAMPGLTGLELARRIQATESPPVMVLMSGQICPGDEYQFREAGFSAVLNKPVDQQELLAVLERLNPAR